MVRKLLRGSFENTSMAIFNPDGTNQLTRGARTPEQVFSDHRGPGAQADSATIIGKMNRIALQFPPITKGNPLLQDFDSLRQALNVASADQRLLVVVNAPRRSLAKQEVKLRAVFADDEIIGRFHMHILDPEQDAGWEKVISRASSKPGITIVYAGKFGLDGRAVAQLGLSGRAKTIKQTLLKINQQFSQAEERKDYASHVREGRRNGINFENTIPYGEDRDGDGKPDEKRRQQGQGR